MFNPDEYIQTNTVQWQTTAL